MRIGVIGAGRIGGNAARLFAKAGHDVLVSFSRDQRKLEALAAEIAGGAGLIVPATRRPAGWWLIATLVAIFPANVWMAQHPERYRVPGGRAALIARLPLQAVFVALVRAAMHPR